VSPFVFGKLPSHGDFVSRGLSAQERDAWDSFASEGMERAIVELGDAFDEAYASAPPWRFAFGPGRFGDGWRAGAFAPSVDRAGRRFPLVVGSAGAESSDCDLEWVAQESEAAIYAAFEGGDTVDRLVERLTSLTPPRAAAPPRAAFWTLGGEGHSPCSVGHDQPDPLLMVRAIRPDAVEAAA
jgi:type VI secretion system ImpM family protein